MARTRTDDDSVTYWFLWKHPMARRRALEFGLFDQTPRKWARRLGPMGVATHSCFLHKITIAKASARPFGPRHLPLSTPLHENNPNVGSVRRASPLERRKCTRRQFFAPSTFASRSLTCCARLRPRRVSIILYQQDCSMRSFKKTKRHVCICYFSSVKYQFYIHFQNKYQRGGFVH